MRIGAWEQYNFRTDPGEGRNLIDQHPDVAARLIEKYLVWETRVGVVPYEQLCKLRTEFTAKKP